MSLTEKERRQLEEIADDLVRADPGLARALTRPVRRPRLRRAAGCLLLLSLGLLIFGALARQPLVCVIAWAGLLNAAAILIAVSGLL